MQDSGEKLGWFQIHLSTCVVLMFVLGGFIGANFIPYTRNDLAINNAPGPRWHAYGRPLTIYAEAYQLTSNDPMDYFECSREIYWFPVSVLIDGFVAAVVILGAVLLCEWRIRRTRRIMRPQTNTDIFG